MLNIRVRSTGEWVSGAAWDSGGKICAAKTGEGILLILPREVAGAVPDVAPPPPALETGAVDDPEGLFRFLREAGLVWLDGLRRVEEMGSPGVLLLKRVDNPRMAPRGKRDAEEELEGEV
jgi:hypothetical protein